MLIVGFILKNKSLPLKRLNQFEKTVRYCFIFFQILKFCKQLWCFWCPVSDNSSNLPGSQYFHSPLWYLKNYQSNQLIGLMGRVFANGQGDLHLSVVAIEKGAFWSPSTKVSNFTYFSIDIILMIMIIMTIIKT